MTLTRAPILFDRKIYFDEVRHSLFGGSLTQQQVDGQEFKLATWEFRYPALDRRFLAYCLASSYWETGKKMWPVEEIGRGKGRPYGVPVDETGEIYFGRGDVQMTWANNYKRATDELNLTGDDDLYWHPDRALDPSISAACLYQGLIEGWWRGDKYGRQTLGRYFDIDTDDPYQARECVNGDKSKVPAWSKGVSIGNLIAGYHREFLAALIAAKIIPPPDYGEQVVTITIRAPPGVRVEVIHEEEATP